MEISIFMLGFFSWFITGVDDMLIFAWIWGQSKSKYQKTFAIIGFVSGVLIMIMVSTFFSEIIKYIKYTNIILGLFLIYIGINTFLNNHSELEFKSKNICLLTFLGYILNCSDDIIWNTSMIANRLFSDILIFFIGLGVGVLSTIFIVRFYSDNLRQYSKIRGVTMIIIGIVILLKQF